MTYRPSRWFVIYLLALSLVVTGAAGFKVGRKTATPVVYFNWLYVGQEAGGRPVDRGNDVVLLGTQGRQWTARISLDSCQWYRKGRGYPSCPKAWQLP